MSADRELIIEADGTVSAIYGDDLADLFPDASMRTRRASHVEPSVLRMFGVDGWVADMSPVGGPLLLDGDRPFATRQAALDAETAWLRAAMAAGPLEAR